MMVQLGLLCFRAVRYCAGYLRVQCKQETCVTDLDSTHSLAPGPVEASRAP